MLVSKLTVSKNGLLLHMTLIFILMLFVCHHRVVALWIRKKFPKQVIHLLQSPAFSFWVEDSKGLAKLLADKEQIADYSTVIGLKYLQ